MSVFDGHEGNGKEKKKGKFRKRSKDFHFEGDWRDLSGQKRPQTLF